MTYDDYDPIALGDGASVGAIAAALQSHLSKDALPGPESAITLAEVDIPAIHGAFWDPNDFSAPVQQIDRAVQVKWFTAACDVAREHSMTGLVYWNIDLNSFTSSTNDTNNQNGWVRTKAASAIKRCFEHTG